MLLNFCAKVSYFPFSCQYSKKKVAKTDNLLSSGGPTRTDDLRVMSPTSYQLLHPAMYVEINLVS
jgi:hypothetical protein